MMKAMENKFPAYRDIRQLLGPISDNAVTEILSFKPTWADLEVVAAYLAGETDVIANIFGSNMDLDL